VWVTAVSGGPRDEEVDARFRCPLAEFASARHGLAARPKEAGRRDEADRVEALAKPSAPAWAADQIFGRHRDTLDGRVAARARVRRSPAAQLAGKRATLREALEARRAAFATITGDPMGTRSAARWWTVLAGALAVALLGTARAAPAQGYVSPFIGYDFGGDSGCPAITGCEDKNLNVGVSVGSLGALFGSELEFAYARNFVGEAPGVSSSVLTLMGNAMLAPSFGPVRPYGVIGLGLIKTRADLTARGLLETNNNHFGWDVGGGLMLFFGPHVGVRGEVRYLHAFNDLTILGLNVSDTKLDFGRASGGVVFKF
jgi:opacity protein-like surface antigen